MLYTVPYMDPMGKQTHATYAFNHTLWTLLKFSMLNHDWPMDFGYPDTLFSDKPKYVP